MKLRRSLGSLMVATALAGGAWSGQASACGAEPFLGIICIAPYNFAPVGFFFTNGQILPINQFTALFSLLGTTYGGNGTNNFALPDTRGRVIVGAGQGPGLSNHDLGEMSGSESVTLTQGQMPAHTHDASTSISLLSALLKGNSATGNADGPEGNSLAAKPRGAQYSASAPNVIMASGSVVLSGNATTSIGVAGGSQPFAIMPPYVVLNYIIAAEGIFPSRN
jgi:microcystin-dependent protein